MRFLWLVLAAALFAGCSGGANESEPVASDLTPVAVTEQWIDAVVAGDAATIDPLVEPVGLAVIAAVENNLRSNELVSLLDSGLDGDLEQQYWALFAQDFESIRGIPFGETEVGAEIPIAVEGFTSVEVTNNEATGRVILRQGDTGWQVDFAATVGPALVGPLGEYLSAAIEGENAVVIVGAFGAAIVPGLDAAVLVDPTNRDLEFETEYIRQLVAR